MAFNDIYRLRVWGRVHGQAVCNVYHFKQVSPSVGNTSPLLAADFNTNMSATLRGRMSSGGGAALEFIEVQRIVPYGDVPHFHNWVGSTTGTLGGNCSTATVAEVLTLYTGQAGRRKRGRLYLWGGANDYIWQGQWVSTQTTPTTAYAAALMTRYGSPSGGGEWHMGVWSRVIAGPAPPFNTDAMAPVISITVRTTVRNQRRRQIGVGR